MGNKRIKKAVIREDLLFITGDYRKAIILNQFIYWAERVQDADDFIKFENEIARKNGEDERELLYGWIYKTADDMADEIMLGLSASQVRRYINDLVDFGYIIKRNNPKYKWDRTLQYRVNLVKIAKDLYKNGFPLSDYKISICESVTIAHEHTIIKAPKENQKLSDGGAIPENTNRDYSTKTTDKDLRSVNDLSLQENTGNIYTPDSANPGEPSADLPDETGIETVVSEVVDDLGIEQSETKDIAEDINTLITTFNTLSTDKPRNLTKTGLSKITYGYLMPPENMDDAGVDDYVAMLKEYFKTDFGARGRYKGKITRSLEHFMSDGIRSRLYERCRQNE